MSELAGVCVSSNFPRHHFSRAADSAVCRLRSSSLRTWRATLFCTFANTKPAKVARKASLTKANKLVLFFSKEKKTHSDEAGSLAEARPPQQSHLPPAKLYMNGSRRIRRADFENVI